MPTIMAVEADWNRRCCSGIGFLTNQQQSMIMTTDQLVDRYRVDSQVDCTIGEEFSAQNILTDLLILF